MVKFYRNSNTKKPFRAPGRGLVLPPNSGGYPVGTSPAPTTLSDAFVVVANPGDGGNGGGPVTPPPGPVYNGEPVKLSDASFKLQNFANAPSPGFHRFGTPLAVGDVPAGAKIEIRRGSSVIPCQFDGRVTWNNGSGKLNIAAMCDADFSANEERTYDIWVVPGAYDNTSTKTLSDILSGIDLSINLTNVRETSSWGDDGYSQVGSGNYSATLAQHAGVATRRTKVRAGPIVDAFEIWGMAYNGGNTSSPDGHLTCRWHVDAWKNPANGAILGYEVGVVVEQARWKINNKKRRRYDAAFKNGSTTLGSYGNVNHPYFEAWLTCQSATGNTSGRRFWINAGAAQPTLTYKPSKTYWRKTNLIPWLNKTAIPQAKGSNNDLTYRPCGQQNHRGDIDGVGGYAGRGMVTLFDGALFMRQGAFDAALARINAHCGFHVFYNQACDDMRTRPGESADISSGIHSLMLRASGGVSTPAYDFTSDGMPAPVLAYIDRRNWEREEAFKINGWSPAEGGGGDWKEETADASHAVSYSAFMYMWEGEMYHLRAVQNCGVYDVQRCLYDGGGGNTVNLLSVGEFASITGAPWVEFEGTIQWHGQERALGLALNRLGAASALTPDNAVEARYLKRLTLQNDLYLAEMFKYMHPNIENNGFLPKRDPNFVPWMTALTSQGATYCGIRNEMPNMIRFGKMLANASINQAKTGAKALMAYRGANKMKSRPWHPTTNPYLPAFRLSDGPGMHLNVQNGNNRVTNAEWTVFRLVNGDAFYPMYESEYEGNPKFIPSVLNEGSPHYVVNITYTNNIDNGPGYQQFGLSLTPGGPPITFNHSGKIFMSCLPKNAAFNVGDNTPTYGYTPAPDDYETIAKGAILLALQAGHPGVTDEVLTKIRGVLQFTDQTVWPPWDLEV